MFSLYLAFFGDIWLLRVDLAFLLMTTWQKVDAA